MKRALRTVLPLALVILAGESASAATLRVPTDYPTIQAAVDAANGETNDEILIAAGTYRGRIEVPAGKDGISIRGEGADASHVKLDGEGGQILVAFSIVNLEFLTFANATHTFWYVGGTALSEACSVRSCRFVGNRTGLYIMDRVGSVVVQDCTFEENYVAASIRGIDVRLLDCEVRRNEFGFRMRATTAIVERNEFHSNLEFGLNVEGTGPSGASGSAAISHCTFEGQERAGLRTVTLNSLDVYECRFVDNQGAGFAGEVSYLGVGSIRRSQFLGNRASVGGGIYLSYGTTWTIEECTFAGNIAERNGGAIGLFTGNCSDCQMQNAVTVSDCTFDSNAAPYGAHLCASPAYVEALALTRCVLVNATLGEALWATDDQLSISCTDIHGNAGGDWTGDWAWRLGAEDNLSVGPQFCHADPMAEEDWSIAEGSPTHEVCSMGAWSVLPCGTSAIEELSWGGIKSLYR